MSKDEQDRKTYRKLPFRLQNAVISRCEAIFGALGWKTHATEVSLLKKSMIEKLIIFSNFLCQYTSG